jgi:hypothetical protein
MNDRRLSWDRIHGSDIHIADVKTALLHTTVPNKHARCEKKSNKTHI